MIIPCASAKWMQRMRGHILVWQKTVWANLKLQDPSVCTVSMCEWTVESWLLRSKKFNVDVDHAVPIAKAALLMVSSSDQPRQISRVDQNRKFAKQERVFTCMPNTWDQSFQTILRTINVLVQTSGKHPIHDNSRRRSRNMLHMFLVQLPPFPTSLQYKLYAGSSKLMPGCLATIQS